MVSNAETMVGDGVDLDRLLYEAIEEQPPGSRCSSVEAKCELVEVVLKMRFADAAVIRSQPPALQKGGDSVNAQHGHVGREPGGPQTRWTMLIAVTRKRSIA